MRGSRRPLRPEPRNRRRDPFGHRPHDCAVAPCRFSAQQRHPQVSGGAALRPRRGSPGGAALRLHRAWCPQPRVALGDPRTPPNAGPIGDEWTSAAGWGVGQIRLGRSRRRWTRGRCRSRRASAGRAGRRALSIDCRGARPKCSRVASACSVSTRVANLSAGTNSGSVDGRTAGHGFGVAAPREGRVNALGAHVVAALLRQRIGLVKARPMQSRWAGQITSPLSRGAADPLR